MSIPVLLRDVVEQMELVNDELSAFLNRQTGELFSFTDEEMELADQEDELEDLPDWQREDVKKTREVLDSGDWVQLPDKFDIHEWAIMEKFCRSVSKSELREELLTSIRGRGAFRIFRDTIDRHDIQDDWYRYRTSAFEEIAITWLEDHGVAYKREE